MDIYRIESDPKKSVTTGNPQTSHDTGEPPRRGQDRIIENAERKTTAGPGYGAIN